MNKLPKKFFTVKDVAKILGFSTNTVYKYLEEGTITSTRLGKEGRFRIPAGEVEKLLDENGDCNEIPDLDIYKDRKFAIFESKKEGAPSLFDWFVGFLSMGLGFSQFIFPPYSLDIQSARFSIILNVLHILLFSFGTLLILTDVFKLKSNKPHDLLHKVLGVIFFIISIILIIIGATLESVGYASIALVIFTTAFKKLGQAARFLLFFNIALFALGIVGFTYPKSFYLSSIVSPTKFSLFIFFIIWLVMEAGLILLTIKIIKGGIREAKILGVVMALAVLVYSVFAFSGGFWNRAVYCVILASFAILFPFSNKFEAFSLRSKKEMVLGFSWLLVLFLIGSAVLYFINTSFRSYILKELTNRINTASDIVTNFVNGNESKLTAFVDDNDVIKLMQNQTEIDMDEADSFLKQIYIASNGTYRRVVLVGKTGTILDTYPYNPSSQGVDLSDRDFFQGPRDSKKLFVTGIIQPSSAGVPPAVLITAPILDRDGNFLGVLEGSTDIGELVRRIEQVKFGQSGKFILADADVKYIIAPTTDEVLAKAPSNSYVSMAVDGKSGVGQGYDANGRLSFMSYRHVEKYGWGIVALQPYAEAFRNYNISAFVIFLVFLMSGVGSIILTINLERRNQDKKH